MPQRSADKPGSTFSTRGGCVHTMEKPKPRSAVRVNFFVIVKGVRPIGFELERRLPPGVVGTASLDGGSSSRKRRKRFSSASRWCKAFLLKIMGACWWWSIKPPDEATGAAILSILTASSVLRIWVIAAMVNLCWYDSSDVCEDNANGCCRGAASAAATVAGVVAVVLVEWCCC